VTDISGADCSAIRFSFDQLQILIGALLVNDAVLRGSYQAPPQEVLPFRSGKFGAVLLAFDATHNQTGRVAVHPHAIS
jgi:hypothetical protein